ncbi:hypothetical protein F4703DRAFT_1868252 [Phycomyces blakesleeanus]
MATMLKAKALFDCNAEDEGEISFKTGDILVDVKKSTEPDWYVGRLQGTSTRGLFPFNYVEFITENSATLPRLIPNQDSSESSKNAMTASVSPPNSIMSSTWSVISTNLVNPDENDNQKPPLSKPANKPNSSYDAFEFAMGPSSFKSSRPLVSPFNGNNTAHEQLSSALQSPGIKPKPAVGPKPAQADMPVIKKDRPFDTSFGSSSSSSSSSSTATTTTPVAEKPNFKTPFMKNDISSRTRSLSTSVVTNREIPKAVKPSLLQKDQDTRRAFEGAVGKLGTMTPKSLPNTRSGSFSKPGVTNEIQPKLQLKPSEDHIEHDEDEEDGEYQLVRPSQLRHKQQQIPVLFGTKPPTSTLSTKKSLDSTINKKQSSLSSFPVLPVSNNPAPKLPSRPTSKANRRSKASHSTELKPKTNSSSAQSDSIMTIEEENNLPDNNNTPIVNNNNNIINNNNINNHNHSNNLSHSHIHNNNNNNNNNISSNRAPPSLKPKPAQVSGIITQSPTLPNRPKARSTSNPPPILPKPSDTPGSSGLHTSNQTHRPPLPPIVNKPVIKPTARSGISKAFNPSPKTTDSGSSTNLPMLFQGSTIAPKPNLGPIPSLPARPAKELWQAVNAEDKNIKPSAILNNRSRSATNPSYNCDNSSTSNNNSGGNSADLKFPAPLSLKSTVDSVEKDSPIKTVDLEKKGAPPPPPLSSSSTTTQATATATNLNTNATTAATATTTINTGYRPQQPIPPPSKTGLSSSSNSSSSSSSSSSNSSNSNNNNNNNSNSNNNTEPEKKKVAPPPPPSRPARNTSLSSDTSVDAWRYQTLFDTIQDEGFVDGQTAKLLWQRSHLPSPKLAQIWRECDPYNNGLLDKQAFVLGMSKIDLMLKKYEETL